VGDGLRVGAGIVDLAGRLPGVAAVGRAREPGWSRVLRIAGIGEAGKPIPDRVSVLRVERVRGDGLLVHHQIRVDVVLQRLRLVPGESAIGRAADEHGAVHLVLVERVDDHQGGAGRTDRDPRIGPALVGAAAASREPRGGPLPGVAAIERDGTDYAVGTAVGPAVLLPDAD